MGTLKKILKVLLGIASIIFLLFVIMGFYYSLKTGIIWLLSEIILIALFLSLTNKSQILNLKKPIRILLSILFFVLFSWGAVALSESEKYKETIVVNKIAPSENLNKVDEVKTEIPPVDNTKLIEFQKTWSDSVVKSWNGQFIINNSRYA
jgi:energy-coupling factor transporter transmembrane protein EcfT